MKSAETILTWCAAGVLVAAVMLIPYSNQVDDRPRRNRSISWSGSGKAGARNFTDDRVSGGGRAGEVTVIKPVMPKPLFIGSGIPSNDTPPNLEKSNVPPVREVTVPRNVSLLSRGALVTSSDPAPLGELSLVTDGDKQGDDGYGVELLPGQQWVQIDLGDTREIWLIWQWKYHKMGVIYKDVIIEISDDVKFGTSRIVFNNDHDNTSGRGIGTDEAWVEANCGRAIQTHGARGRYVRLWSNGRNIDDTNQWIEVEVFGRRTSSLQVPESDRTFISPPPDSIFISPPPDESEP